MSFGFGDGGQVESRDLFVGGGEGGDLCGRSRDGEVMVVEAVSADEVSDVDDGADHVLVEAVPFVQPGPAAGPKFVEWLAGDELKRGPEVGDPFGAAGFTAEAEPAEEVGVDQEALDLIDADAAGLSG
jgi:hypothetical protein